MQANGGIEFSRYKSKAVVKLHWENAEDSQDLIKELSRVLMLYNIKTSNSNATKTNK